MNTIPNVRTTDPLTSYIAADKALKFRQSHADRILSALKAHGPASAHKLEMLTGLSVVQIDRRLVEMQRDGLIDLVMAGGVPLVAGGCRVWRAV